MYVVRLAKGGRCGGREMRRLGWVRRAGRDICAVFTYVLYIFWRGVLQVAMGWWRWGKMDIQDCRMGIMCVQDGRNVGIGVSTDDIF